MLWVRAIPGVQPPWRPASAGAGDGKAIPNHKSRRQIGDCRYTVRPKPNDGRAKISKFIGTNAGLRNFYVCVRVTVLRRLAVARRQQPWSITGGETGPEAADTQAAGACRRMEWDTRRPCVLGLVLDFSWITCASAMIGDSSSLVRGQAGGEVAASLPAALLFSACAWRRPT
jgi:hypothetical protein